MEYLGFSKKNYTIFLCFFALIFIIYGQSLFGDFVYDDRNIIEHTEILSDMEYVGKVIMHPFWNPESALYRPTTLLSYMFNFAIWGNGPFSFHFINLILYLFICFFIYQFVKKLFKNEALALTTALLFLLFPIHSEVVANISGRGELLALFFSLLVLLEFVKEKINWWLAGIWTLLAMGSKETAIAIFPLILLLLYIKEHSIASNVGRKMVEIMKKYFREIASVFVAICFYFFLRFFSLGPTNFFSLKTSLIENPLIFTDLGSRMVTSFKITWMYFEKMLWPVNLCSDYSYNQIPVTGNFFNFETILGFTLLLLSILLIPLLVKGRSVIAFGLAIFIFSFIPVSNTLFTTGTIAGERLFFFPSFGWALVISFILYKVFILMKKESLKIILLVLVVGSLFMYGLLSFKRQGVWLDEESLFLSAAQCAPNSVLSRSNVGAIYLIKGDLDKAEKELKLAMSIKPIYSKGINNLGLVYFKKGELDKARNLYLQALQQEFPYGGTYENLILLYLSNGDIDRAKHWLTFLYPNNEELIEVFIGNHQVELEQ